MRDDLDPALSVWGFNASLLGEGEREEEVEGKRGEKGDTGGKEEEGGNGEGKGREEKRSCRRRGWREGHGREAGEDDWLPSVILSSEGEERMRKQEIRFKGRMEGGGR